MHTEIYRRYFRYTARARKAETVSRSHSKCGNSISICYKSCVISAGQAAATAEPAPV